jgi:hypothetical protein
MNRVERLRTLNPNSELPRTNILVRIHTSPANAPNPAGEDAMGIPAKKRQILQSRPW